MEGLAHANFRGLEKHLTPKPADAQAWIFARGQALLLAETANLLMLRPPKNKGETLWFERHHGYAAAGDATGTASRQERPRSAADWVSASRRQL